MKRQQVCWGLTCSSLEVLPHNGHNRVQTWCQNSVQSKQKKHKHRFMFSLSLSTGQQQQRPLAGGHFLLFDLLWQVPFTGSKWRRVRVRWPSGISCWTRSPKQCHLHLGGVRRATGLEWTSDLGPERQVFTLKSTDLSPRSRIWTFCQYQFCFAVHVSHWRDSCVSLGATNKAGNYCDANCAVLMC